MPGTQGQATQRAIEQIRSADPGEQATGIESLAALGAVAVPALLSLLQEPDATTRACAIDALARIADSTAAFAFLGGLDDSDERVRAYAARGLAKINHPSALAAAFQTLNDAPDELHNDITPAVNTLGEMGLSALPMLLDRLDDQDQLTRLRAQRALEQIVYRRHGFQPGHGFPSPGHEQQARAEWHANGDYSYDADPAAREIAVAKWRRWAASQGPSDGV
jgi:HEAT repeat protein